MHMHVYRVDDLCGGTVGTRQGWLSGNGLHSAVAQAGAGPEPPRANVVPIAAATERSSARLAMAPAHEATSSSYLTRIAVRSLNRLVIVPVSAIVRLEAEDNYVRIWADRPYLHKDTLSGLVAKLDPQRFLRVHRSHAVAIDAVRELHPQLHGEYLIVLCDGTEITSGRSYKTRVQEAFGLGRSADEREPR